MQWVSQIWGSLFTKLRRHEHHWYCANHVSHDHWRHSQSSTELANSSRFTGLPVRSSLNTHTRASIVYDNILRFSQDSLRSTLTGHFQYRENDKKICNSPLVTHYLLVNQCEDNNTVQLNQPHKQYNSAPISVYYARRQQNHITAETQPPHKSDS